MVSNDDLTDTAMVSPRDPVAGGTVQTDSAAALDTFPDPAAAGAASDGTHQKATETALATVDVLVGFGDAVWSVAEGTAQAIFGFFVEV